MLIINTGGTFNKIYNPIKGALEVNQSEMIVEQLLQNFPNLKYEIKSEFYIDSLDMKDFHREKLVQMIQNSHENSILIIHGTDTMNKTASFLDKKIKNKSIVLTGAMVPFSIDLVEASCNFAMSVGFLLSKNQNGVYIGMHGAINSHENLYKDKKEGIFKLL